jgi:NAD(P)H-dependent FMN reductase
MTVSREPLHIVVLSGSSRADSLNTRLAHLAVSAIQAEGGTAELVTVKDFGVPPYDGDVEQREGIPEGARTFRERLVGSNAMVVSCPEYNASMPGVVKNLIDWTSRFRPHPFNELQGLLMSASPSMVGGNRGLWSLRIPLEHLGARIYPDMFSLAQAHTAFGEDGRLHDATLQKRFEANLQSFLNLVEADTNYPCIKKTWVEYLGERPDPAVDRTQAV